MESQELFTHLTNDEYSQISSTDIDKFELFEEKDTIHFQSINLKERCGKYQNRNLFFETIHDSDFTLVKLYSKDSKDFIKESDIGKVGIIERDNRFENKEKYFLISDLNCLDFSNNEKSIIKKMPNIKSQILDLIKYNNIELKNEDDLVVLWDALYESFKHEVQ